AKIMSRQKSLLDFLNKFIPLSLDEYNELIAPCILKRHFDKKSVITSAGQVENYLNFIDSGLARKYYKKTNEEVNTQISYEGHIIDSQDFFYAQAPSEYIIKITDFTIYIPITIQFTKELIHSKEKNEQLNR